MGGISYTMRRFNRSHKIHSVVDREGAVDRATLLLYYDDDILQEEVHCDTVCRSETIYSMAMLNASNRS